MDLLLATISIWHAHIWYSIPLSIVISLVYGGTRHEETAGILEQAWKAFAWIVLFLAAIAAVVFLGGFGVS